MRKTAVLLFSIVLVFTATGFAKEYPVSNTTIDTVGRFFAEGQGLRQELEKLKARDATLLVIGVVDETETMLLSVQTLLALENSHGAKNQIDPDAITLLKVYIQLYSGTKDTRGLLDKKIDYCVTIRNVSKDTAVIGYVDKTADYLQRIKKALVKVVTELP